MSMRYKADITTMQVRGCLCKRLLLQDAQTRGGVRKRDDVIVKPQCRTIQAQVASASDQYQQAGPCPLMTRLCERSARISISCNAAQAYISPFAICLLSVSSSSSSSRPLLRARCPDCAPISFAVVWRAKKIGR